MKNSYQFVWTQSLVWCPPPRDNSSMVGYTRGSRKLAKSSRKWDTRWESYCCNYTSGETWIYKDLILATHWFMSDLISKPMVSIWFYSFFVWLRPFSMVVFRVDVINSLNPLKGLPTSYTKWSMLCNEYFEIGLPQWYGIALGFVFLCTLIRV